MSVQPITARPLILARRAAIAAADNLSIAMAYEGQPDARAVTSLDDAEDRLQEALRLIQKARGPVPPVPPTVAATADAALSHHDYFATACAIARAAQPHEAA